jgi:hypothetical protein
MNDFQKEINKRAKSKQTIDELAMCHVESIHYNTASKVGSFVLEGTHCTDMTGAIAIFTRIDPEVRAVVDGDMIFQKVEGKWTPLQLGKNPNNKYGSWNAKDIYTKLWGAA